ncbi:uncharacterized protein LOC143183832 [Calliopsis andreniformis]|uniref:uncharacterized protein LOC143183832 n=1 Tax=Calliopsis andreniformis TaxID=337506 RepID=UPI003FCE0C2D
MQRSHSNNQSWSFHISANDNFNDLWPELCPKDPIKPSTYKNQSMNTEENNETIVLDDFEYPKLNDITARHKYSIIAKKNQLRTPILRVLIPTHTTMEPKKSRALRKFRRTDKICINLQEALQNTVCINKGNNKELPRLRINIYRASSGALLDTTDENKSCKIQKVGISISKDRKPSRLKRIILLNRDRRAQINVEKRETFERQKIEAICKDVDEIDFSALNITADPEIDVDYAKSVRTMTLYGKDYRNKQEENISEPSVYYRPDIIKKINNLHIQNFQIRNIYKQDQLPANNSQCFIKPDYTVENEIIEQTLSLKIKDDIKEENIIEPDTKNFLTYSCSFREYCTNMLTLGFNESLEKFLENITRLQKKLYEKNPQKSKYRRRYYSGLKEVRKHVELKKIKFVIIAPDLEKVELEGGLDDQIIKLLDACQRQNVAFCFGLRRRKLGYFAHGKGFVGCVGVANYSGTEELFKNVLIEVVHARNAFKKLSGATDAIIDISKLISEDNLLSENVNALLKILSPTNILT